MTNLKVVKDSMKDIVLDATELLTRAKRLENEALQYRQKAVKVDDEESKYYKELANDADDYAVDLRRQAARCKKR